MADPNTRSELNRLYWASDASVSEIADRLDISRRALYDGIEPRPADRPCPECGAPLGYRNRTALDNREAECPECGYEANLRRAGGREDGSATPSDRQHSMPDPSGPGSRARTLPTAGSGPTIGIAFVSGLAVGAVVTLLARRG